jgi:hypothetical protein
LLVPIAAELEGEEILFNSEDLPEAFQVAAFVDLWVGGSMCHTERYFVEKAIYINPAGSFRVLHRYFGVSYRAAVLGTVCGHACFTGNVKARFHTPLFKPKI